jgi:hypothetical protein
MTPEQQVNGPLNELLEAAAHRRRLETELAVVEKFIADVEPTVREKFMQDGTQNVRRELGTAYMRHTVKLKQEAPLEVVIDTLRTLGYDDFISEKYDWGRVCSEVKEIEDRGDDVPPELLALFTKSDEYRVIVRKP